MSPLARATSLVQRPGALASDPTFPARTAWSRRSRPFLPVPSARPSLPARAARPPSTSRGYHAGGRPAGPVEGLPAPGSRRRAGGCPVSTPARLLQRGLAEFSVGEAHQAAAITAGPAYGSHLRGTGGPGQARCGGGRGLELRRGRRSPAEAEHRARTGAASAQQQASWTQRRGCLLGCGNCAAAPRMRTAAAAACLARSSPARAKVMVALLCAALRVARLPGLVQPACLVLRPPRQEEADVSSKCLDLSVE